MTLTKFEAELRLNEVDMYASMQRRMDSMIAAARRYQQWGKNKNAGVHAALMAALYEINDRMGMAHLMSRHDGLGADMAKRELHHYYPIIRKMYDQFAASRLLEPSEVTESTLEGHLRDARQRERDNPVLIWAHDEGCTVDHTPNGPRAGRKNCPTQDEWDD